MSEKSSLIYPESEHEEMGQFTPKRGFWAWISTLWPLILHCILAISTAAFVTRYINDRHFNLTDRRPSVLLADGTIIQTGQYGLLQSDITTFLSAILVALRMILAAWAGSLCW